MKREKSLAPRGPELLKPVGALLVGGSLAVAFLFGLLPWPAQIHWLVPDFALMALLYWNIHAPRLAPLGVAFLLGLLVDSTHGVLFGLHALAYTTATFVTLGVRRRLENFPPAGQTLHLAPLFLGKEAMVLLLGLAFGRSNGDWRHVAAGLVGAMLWLPLCLLLNQLTGRPTMKPAPEEER